MRNDSSQKITESFLNLHHIFNAIGKTDPYYSVLSDPKYITKNLTDDSLSQFHASGFQEVAFLIETIAQCGIPLETGEALDFGCGVGRVTIPLCRRFASVVGCDISTGNLSIGLNEAKNKGLSNVQFVKNEFNLIRQFGEERFDLIYSMIVLQHMIPPLMKIYISQFARMLKPGGIAFFQLPTSGADYSFDQHKLQESIQSQTVQIHALAFRELFKIINSEGCQIVDLFERDCVGPGWDSYIIVMTKP